MFPANSLEVMFVRIPMERGSCSLEWKVACCFPGERLAFQPVHLFSCTAPQFQQEMPLLTRCMLPLCVDLPPPQPLLIPSSPLLLPAIAVQLPGNSPIWPQSPSPIGGRRPPLSGDAFVCVLCSGCRFQTMIFSKFLYFFCSFFVCHSFLLERITHAFR